jgi:hypothetical protein
VLWGDVSLKAPILTTTCGTGLPDQDVAAGTLQAHSAPNRTKVLRPRVHRFERHVSGPLVVPLRWGVEPGRPMLRERMRKRRPVLPSQVDRSGT